MQKPDPTLAAAQNPAYLQGALLAAAATILGAAIHFHDSTYTVNGIVLLSVALVAALAATLTSLHRLKYASHSGLLVGALLGCFLTQFALAMTKMPGAYQAFAVPAHRLTVYWALAALAAVACGALLAPESRRGRLIVPALVALQLALCLWIIGVDPEPRIDVYEFSRDAVQSLVGDINPYTLAYPDVYSKAETQILYGPGLVKNGLVQTGYPYMPLTLFLSVPGGWIGDIRFSTAAALALTALMIAFARDNWLSYAAAAGLLFMPRTLFTIDQAWTDPLVLFVLVLTAFCAVRRPKLTPFAFGLLLASKQYMAPAVLLAPLLFGWNPRRLIISLCVAGATAIAVTLPLVLWDPGAFIHSAVMFHLRQPFRADALSYLAWWYHVSADSRHLPAAIGFAGLFVVAALALWRFRPGPFNFLAALATCYFVFFAFNQQAFVNYYFVVIGALWAAVGLIQTPPASPIKSAA